MTLQLYNSLTRRKEVFEPIDPERVTMYVCGPTVYNHPHIGNARPPVVFDVLFRLLSLRYPQVVYARNITDLDDKINAAAHAAGVGIDVITKRYTEIFRQESAALGVRPPTLEPLATEHIPEMVELIARLIELGHAYEAEGHVLFHVPSDERYGHLSRRNRDDMVAGARVEVAPYKRDPADFVLWKPSDDTQPGWDSPWGWGRPGWHTECACMVDKHLGTSIDIHGGGMDLQFPHHENELAQAECAQPGSVYARYWVHNAFVNMKSEKMSKSLGNVLLVRDLLAEAPGEAIRFALMSTHYRHPLDWGDDTVPQALRRLDRLYETLGRLEDVEAADAPPPAAIVAALEDDLNTPLALNALNVLARDAQAATGDGRAVAKGELLAAGSLLGLLRHSPSEWLEKRGAGALDEDEAAEIDAMVAARDAARTAKDFAEADRLRDELNARRITLEDGPEGTRWRKAVD